MNEGYKKHIEVVTRNVAVIAEYPLICLFVARITLFFFLLYSHFTVTFLGNMLMQFYVTERRKRMELILFFSFSIDIQII